MTIIPCFTFADLVSLLSSLYFISLKNLIIFSTSHSFSSSVLMSPWILCFFLLSLHWEQSCRQCIIVRLWFLHAAFPHVGLLVISRHQMSVGQSRVSNTYPTQFKLVLPTAVVSIFPFFDAWFNVVQLASIFFPFSLPLGASCPPYGQVVSYLYEVVLSQ